MKEFDLSAEVRDNLKKYSAEIQEGVVKEIDITSEELKKDLRRESPRRKGTKLRSGKSGKRYAPGSYAKSWNTRVSEKSFATYEKQVYNRSHYQLTHLLEKGHEARNGTRVAPIEHIAPLERKAVDKYEKRIIKLIKSTE